MSGGQTLIIAAANLQHSTVIIHLIIIIIIQHITTNSSDPEIQYPIPYPIRIGIVEGISLAGALQYLQVIILCSNGFPTATSRTRCILQHGSRCDQCYIHRFGVAAAAACGTDINWCKGGDVRPHALAGAEERGATDHRPAVGAVLVADVAALTGPDLIARVGVGDRVYVHFVYGHIRCFGDNVEHVSALSCSAFVRGFQ